MDRSYTPMYRVEVFDTKLPMKQANKTSMAWLVKEKGSPTNANLEKFILAYGKSFEACGANHHISLSLGYIPYPTKAIIVHQKSGQVVAVWLAPMFMVW